MYVCAIKSHLDHNKHSEFIECLNRSFRMFEGKINRETSKT
jgi:hypothetical protein